MVGRRRLHGPGANRECRPLGTLRERARRGRISCGPGEEDGGAWGGARVHGNRSGGR